MADTSNRTFTDLIEIFPHLPLNDIRAALDLHKTLEQTVSFLLELPIAATSIKICHVDSKSPLTIKQHPCTTGKGRAVAGATGMSNAVAKAVSPVDTPSRFSLDSVASSKLRPVVATSSSISHPDVVSAKLPSFKEATVMLQGLFPEMPQKAVEFALRSRAGCCEDAATYMLEESFQSEWKVMALRDQKKTPEQTGAVALLSAASIGGGGGSVDKDVKARLLRRYDEQVDTSDKTYRPSLPLAMLESGDGKRIMRYTEGKAVFVRPGEKFIVEAPPPDDPSTFVSIKIKRKGKRGAGAGWGK